MWSCVCADSLWTARKRGPRRGRARRQRPAALAARDAGERRARLARHRGQPHRTGDGQDHVRGAVELAEVLPHVAHREAAHVGERPRDREAERVIAPELHARAVVDVDVPAAVVEVLEDFFEDDLPLELDVAQLGRPEKVAQDVHPAAQVPRVEPDLVERVVAAGLGVQRPAQLLDRQVQRVGRRVPLGPAEEHVLEEMREPVRLPPLVARAGPHVQVQRGRVQVRCFDDHQRQTVRKFRPAHPVRRFSQQARQLRHVGAIYRTFATVKEERNMVWSTVLLFDGVRAGGPRGYERSGGPASHTPRAQGFGRVDGAGRAQRSSSREGAGTLPGFPIRRAVV